ncbi:ARPP-2 domain-containing protein [Kitasatospora sp. NPDC088346]|uniref:ARPP-2 domain-containing protein n=1 Tax=Kitasatospora sp. NPDC088346 TaxID=3364073 RepID=UPI003814D5CB
MSTLDLTGLTTRPAQVWGGVRLVPLVRAEPVDGLRLHRLALGGEDGELRYVPHGFVADWAADGTVAAAYGTQLVRSGDGPAQRVSLHFPGRADRRRGRSRARFLPQHLAVDGYLARHLGGPPIAWEQWTRRAVRHGLPPRAEEAYLGAEVRQLGGALRVFELHPGQCGLLVYVADALAGAFVVPHPDDYRALHPTLVQDLFGELVHHYATLAAPVPEFRARIADAGIRSSVDLRAAADRQEREWAAFHDASLAGGLLGVDYGVRALHRMGRFTLARLLPPFRLKQENHIGEAITDEDGRIAYLKTFRLSENQVRRGHLLDRLAAHDWHPGRTAAELGITEAQLGLRLESAGFGSMLRQDVLDGYRKRAQG